MKSFRSVCAVLFLSLVCVAMACGADAAPAVNVFGDSLSALLTNTVFPIMGALTLGFITWAANKIGAKFKIESLTTQNNFLTQLAAQGVAFAEEKGANFAKTAQPLTGNDKLNSAIAYIMQMAPKVTEAQAQSLVTAALAMLPGVGATGAAAVGTPPAVIVAGPPPVALIEPLAVAPA